MVYPLLKILLVILCGTMAGGKDFVETERWARRIEASPLHTVAAKSNGITAIPALLERLELKGAMRIMTHGSVHRGGTTRLVVKPSAMRASSLSRRISNQWDSDDAPSRRSPHSRTVRRSPGLMLP